MLLFLLACSSDYALQGGAPDEPTAEVGNAPAAPSATTSAPSTTTPTFSPVTVEADDGGAFAAEEDTTGTVRRERFVIGGGSSTPVADFLFVVDNSASMAKVVDRVRVAIADLAESEAFPAEARIAVMSTLPGDPKDLRKVHPAVRHRGRNKHDPGFLRLVEAATIDDFTSFASDVGWGHFTTPGCESAWFAPGDHNAADVPCLVAHTQIAEDVVGVEAGLTAFGQLLDARGTTPLFRAGAAANVIFVSDTQDPGLEPGKEGLDALVAARPDYATLANLVDMANTVSSFRVHAIAPERACGEAWAHLGRVYQEAAQASGGRTLDVCTADDYRGFVRDIARDGAVIARPVVALGRPLLDATTPTNVAVEVDGASAGWAPSADGRAIVLDDADVARPHVVTITYPVKPRVR